MKRLFAVLFTVLLLSTALCATASAANFDASAKELASLGMFRGTNNGFELDRAPTRAEAAIMLVRLYGAEEDAGNAYAAGEISHPFTDVPDYAAAHVAWLYSNGITNGTSANTFSSAENCSAENYMTFLMRCLGYKDGTDFEYATVTDFAESKGLFDTSVLSGTFLRDDLASLTYQALACDLKDGSTYLLDSLVESGAVSASAAQPIQDKIETYRTLLAASEEIDRSVDISLGAKANMTIAATGVSDGQPVNEQMSMPIDYSGRVQMILDNDPQMAVTMTGTIDGESMDSSVWLKDGWMYTQADGESYKVNLGSEIDDVMNEYQDMLSASNEQISTMLPFIDTLTVAPSGQDTVYTLTLNDSFAGLMDSIINLLLGSMDDSLPEWTNMDIKLENCRYDYTLDSSGHLRQIDASITMSMNYAMNVNEQNNISVSADVAMDMTMTINAAGSSVSISYPDFSGFEDMTGILEE